MKKQPFAIYSSLPSRIGTTVSFNPPLSSRLKGSQRIFGKIIDEVWANERLNSSPPSKSEDKEDWGDYSFFAQHILWDTGEKQIRLGYYFRPTGENYWRFGSQTTITANWRELEILLKSTLAKKEWFSD